MNFPKRSPEYANLAELNEPWPIIYGPVASRRLGRSLGINLLGAGPKACSYDCLYCDLGFTEVRMRELKAQVSFPTVAEVGEAFRARLTALRDANEGIDNIAIVGNGDPLVYPDLEDVIEILVKIRDELSPGKPLVIMTNGAQIESRRRAQALNKLDERYVKLDAGSDALMKRINNPLIRANVSKVISSVRQLRDTVIQTMFIQGVLDNTTPVHIEDWIECIGLIKPKSVQIYSLARVPAMSGLVKVPEDRLDIIAAQLERRTRIKGTVYG
jgi:wyosine [tRNA(Phe)-imidazoG37] synthetase (radical SAM superfamily)